MLFSLSCLTAYASDGKFSEDDESPEYPMSPDDYENHTHDFSIWRDIPGTDNIHVRHCVCGASEHGECSYDNGVITRHPTVDTEGVKTYTCKDCGGTKTESIAKLTVDEDAPTDEGGKPWIWIVVIVVGVLAVACGAVIAVRVVNKKKSSVADNIDAESTDE